MVVTHPGVCSLIFNVLEDEAVWMDINYSWLISSPDMDVYMLVRSFHSCGRSCPARPRVCLPRERVSEFLQTGCSVHLWVRLLGSLVRAAPILQIKAHCLSEWWQQTTLSWEVLRRCCCSKWLLILGNPGYLVIANLISVLILRSAVFFRYSLLLDLMFFYYNIVYLC